MLPNGFVGNFSIWSGKMVIDFNVNCGLLIGDAISQHPLIDDAINRHPLIGYTLNPVFPYRGMCVCVFGAFSITEF